jgi:hypothetical protein
MSDAEQEVLEQSEIQPVLQPKQKKPRTEAQLNATKRMLEAKAQKREEEIKIKAEELLKQKEIENKLKAKLETKILKKAVKLTNKKVNQKAIANEILDDSDNDSEIQKPIKKKAKPEAVVDDKQPAKETQHNEVHIRETPEPFQKPILKRSNGISLSDFLGK